MELKITNDTSEMIRMAKAIVEEKKDYYTDDVLNKIRSGIQRRKPSDSFYEIENTFYHSIYYYWAYGATLDEYFFYHLAGKSHDEIKTYITEKEKIVYTDHLNNIEDVHILRNKYETYERLKPFFKREMILCDSETCYEEFRDFVGRHPVFVIKPLGLGGGKGIHRDDVSNLPESRIREKFVSLLSETSTLIEKNVLLHDKKSSGSKKWIEQADELAAFHHEHRKKWLDLEQKRGFILEEYIEQADELAAFHPQSVNGVRVPTIRTGDGVHVYQPWLKLGTGNSFVDNAAAGGLLAGIDARSGVVDTNGVSEIPEIFEEHPDSHIRFKGYQIPHWDELLRMVKELAQQMPATIRYVGWDMAFTKKGWALVEGNSRGVFFWQLVRQRGTKAEFEELIGWKLEKEFWWQE